jgi:hypothetical protein
MRLLVSILFLSLVSFQPGDERIGLTNACNYFGGTSTEEVSVYSYQSNSEAVGIIQAIIDVIGLKPNFTIKAGNVDNAAAVVLRGQRHILYNPDFIENIDRATNNRWASISILAHEIGHHLNGHTLTATGSRPNLELEADEFSGFVLRKLGASLTDAQAAMKLAADIRGSHTHPPRAKRLTAIKAGWEHAGQQISGQSQPSAERMTREVQPRQTQEIQEQSEVLAKQYRAYNVKFSIDPEGEYYVTVKNHLVKIDNGQLVVLANMVKSNSKKYPFVLYQGKSNYLFIKPNGVIVTTDGKIAGYMRRSS